MGIDCRNFFARINLKHADKIWHIQILKLLRPALDFMLLTGLQILIKNIALTILLFFMLPMAPDFSSDLKNIFDLLLHL